jgi:hypothetical protein
VLSQNPSTEVLGILSNGQEKSSAAKSPQDAAARFDAEGSEYAV